MNYRKDGGRAVAAAGTSPGPGLGIKAASSPGGALGGRRVIIQYGGGVKSTQEQLVSKIHLKNVSLSVQLVPSTIPELCSLYAVCNFHFMFKVLLTCYTISATKARPLSDPMLVGNPNLGTISLSRHQATFDALSVWVGKAFTHPKNVHTMTSR